MSHFQRRPTIGPRHPSERDFQRAVIEVFEFLGWRVKHDRPARTQSGWATPAQGNGAVGWPDNFAVRGERAVAAELKVGEQKLTPEQRRWLDALVQVPGIEVYVWTPADLLQGRIVEALR